MTAAPAIMVTGGAGFIGQNLVHLLSQSMPNTPLVVVDALTYAANPQSLRTLIEAERVSFVEADVADGPAMADVLARHKITRILHLAAESHVDRSISDPDAFFRTNIAGTYELLKAAKAAWCDGDGSERFLHVSTDEVYGDLSEDDPAFDENTPYRPSSPYSASKAASDHLVRAFGRTYLLPVLITNCSNNYGPYQHPEKLIPLTILNCLRGVSIPVYGNGRNIRDWLYVGDHCAAIERVLMQGRISATYCVGGGAERRNIDVVQTICDAVDARVAAAPEIAAMWPECPAARGRPCRDLITFVTDRPGHDHRYAIDSGKLASELGVRPRQSFESGIGATVDWYVSNVEWWQSALNEDFGEWVARQYGGNSRSRTA